MAESLQLPSIFSEGMVLQRDQPAPVWGRGLSGDAIRVRVLNRAKLLAQAITTVDTDGAWHVSLDPLPAGGRYTLLVEATEQGSKQARERLLFTDVLVGEVWVTCGQSNMIWPLDSAAAREEAVATVSNYPMLRVAMVGVRNAHEVTEPRWDNEGFWGPVKWESAAYLAPRSSKTDIPGSLSAVSHFFARKVSDHFGGDVPVGMIDIGAILPVETWVDSEFAEQSKHLQHLVGKNYPHATGRGFLANIVPLAPYAVRGVIYYQGEMNAGRPVDYLHGLTALIQSWRRAWEQPELPFLIVQLPSFIRHENQQANDLDMDAASLAAFADNTPDHGFVRVREAQRRVVSSLPHVGMSVTLDVGEPFDIHPPKKKPVAGRLFLEARRLVYAPNEPTPASPIYREVKLEPGRARIIFDHAGDGLLLRNANATSGFELQRPSGEWVVAQAQVVGKDTVHVTGSPGETPRGVRYAWRGYPPVTLFNRAGLPAAPLHYPSVELKQ